MSKEIISNIKSSLLSLEEKELIEIQKTISSLLGNKVAPEVPTDKYLELFWKQVTDYLEGPYPPLSVVFNTNRNLYRIVIAAYTFINATIDYYADHSATILIDRRLRSKFYLLYCNLMSNFLKENNIPVSAKTLLLNNAKFPALIDRDFPAYIKSGVLMKVVDSL